MPTLSQYQRLLAETRAQYLEAREDLTRKTNERNGVITALTLVASQRDIVLSELKRIEGDVERGKANLLRLDNSHKDLENRIALKDKRERELDNEYSEKSNRYDERCKLLSDRVNELTELETIKVRQLRIYEGLEEKIPQKIQEISIHESKIGDLKRELNQLRDTIVKEKNELDSEKKVVQELIQTNGRILTDIEKEKERLEIYVRRLQRYYDETGVRLQILPTFGLTKE